MKKLSFFTIISICTFLIFSCSNDVEDSVGNETKSEIRSTNVSDHPTVTNGIYTFRDLNHYLQYCQDLEQLKQSDYRLFAETSSENLDNHLTRDPSVITVFQRLSNDEFENPQDRYMPFLTDPVIMSFANLNFEYRIGDLLITHINNEQFFTSDITDNNLTQQIRNFAKGGKINIDDVPDGAVVGTNITGIHTRSCKCEVDIARSSSDCDEIRVFGHCTKASDPNHTPPNSIVSIKISLTGYGSTDLDLIATVVEGNFDIPVDLSVYPDFNNSTQQPINLFFQVDAEAQCGRGDQARLSFKPREGVCDDNDRETEWEWKEDGGSQAISFRTKVYEGFFASYQEAEIFSYHKSGNIWNNNKSKISSKIRAQRRNAVCEEESFESDSQACDHCKSLNASVNTYDWWFCDGDVNGTFSKTLTWQGNIWTIEAEQEVDFDCCIF